MLFPTTIAGSLPKPEWLAEPNMLWAPWKSDGAELARAKRDVSPATMLASSDWTSDGMLSRSLMISPGGAVLPFTT